MARGSFLYSDSLADYVEKTWVTQPEILAELREETGKMPECGLQISPEQGSFLAFLVRLIGAKRGLEIGVFTGYSSLTVALAMPDDGHIIACDINEEYTSIARKYWAKAGVANKIELRLGPALDTIAGIKAAGERFDFAFIDADKPNYWNYFDAAVQLVRPGGLIACDNVFWEGRVADPSVVDEGTETMRAFNAKVAADPRVDVTLAPVGDGITLARVR